VAVDENTVDLLDDLRRLVRDDVPSGVSGTTDVDEEVDAITLENMMSDGMGISSWANVCEALGSLYLFTNPIGTSSESSAVGSAGILT
jgi:hypothetical protein